MWLRYIQFTVVVLGLALLAGPASAARQPTGPMVFDFDGGLSGWSSPPGAPAASMVSGSAFGRPGQVVEVPLGGNDTGTLRLIKFERPNLPHLMDLSGFEKLRFDVRLPKAGAHMHVAAYFVDRDEKWHQTWKRIMPPLGKWSTVEIDLRPEVAALESVDHARPWGPYVARAVREVGIRVFCDRPVRGSMLLDAVTMIPAPAGPKPQQIVNFETTGKQIDRYGKFEITFELSRFYNNPYDPAEVEVLALFTTPSGRTVKALGFFYQGFERRNEAKVEHLIPVGNPKWKIRFAPREVGTYDYRIQVNDGERLETAPRRFACIPSGDPGFVRVSAKDRRYFEFDDGSFFYPIGHNIPAAFNIKGAKVLGLTVEPLEGTYAYDRFLEGMGRGRENFARIWLGSWSFGLEWSRRYHRSYRDLGRYNQENAWRFDYVMNKAERLGIYVQLALTTFGHFRSEEFEGDWPYSPYNVANGGPLRSPDQFWTHEPSQRVYQQMVRYVMARWGYATHIAGWELSNEIDLVHRYILGQQPNQRLNPGIVAWHDRCIDTIRAFDPNDHLVTTNFAAWSRQKEIIELPRISYSSTNHYNVQIVDVMRRKIYPLKASHGKPAIMAECGYDFTGAQAGTTERYLHICLWSSYMIPFAGSGLSWWWDFLDDRDLYDRFRPLAQFAEGEDRRGRGLEMADGVLLDGSGLPAPQLAAIALKNDRSGYFWLYERRLLMAEAAAVFVPGPRDSIVLQLPDLRNGKYEIEFWDTRTGQPVKTVAVDVKDGALRCPVPTFTSDIAGKIRTAPQQATAANAENAEKAKN